MSKMSEQDWSPEPWSYDGDPDGPLIVDANHRPATDNDADIYRAVACVNAMAGIPDPAALVESHDHMAHLLENLTNGYRFCDGDRAEIEDAIDTAERVRGGRKW